MYCCVNLSGNVTSHDYIHNFNKTISSTVQPIPTRNSSGNEIANVNFLYDDIVHALKIQ